MKKIKLGNDDDDHAHDDIAEYGLYLTSEWKHPQTTDDYCDLFVLLFSGISKNTEYCVNVRKDGKSLGISIKVPDALSDIQTLFKVASANDPDITTDFHPVFSNLTDKLTACKGLKDSLWMKEFSLSLPYVVEQRVVFVECSVGKATGAAILHIRTRKVRDGYANKVRADEDLIKSGEF